MNDAILGCQFMEENGISLNFTKENFTYTKKGLVRERPFYQPAETLRLNAVTNFSVTLILLYAPVLTDTTVSTRLTATSQSRY
jgi:hypothetical protein